MISDTHVPDRCASLPQSVLEVFTGVDLILHAGDIGALTVLDELSAAAPVVAVHGNHEVQAGLQQALPFQQVITVVGHRICLTHGHHPDPQVERLHKQDDRWAAKHARLAAQGIACGARTVVYGHTHVPGVAQSHGVWLINAGALASNSFITRRRNQTVALLYMRDDGVPFTVHIDLAHPDRPYIPPVDWERGYEAAVEEMDELIYTPEALSLYWRAWAWADRDCDLLYPKLRNLFRPLSQRCWSSNMENVSATDILAAVDHLEPGEERTSLQAALLNGRTATRS